MADEPRRSGRATKGQYTKDRDIAEDAAPKKKGRGKAAKAKQVEEDVEMEEEEREEEEDESEELIRCICGTYEEEEDVPRAMICCDNCSAWQHNDCMGLPEDYEPEKYFCEQCKPEQHKDLLAAIARGEKPWEAAAKEREAARSSKKKGKKGRKSAAAAPEPQSTEEAIPVRGGQKRKAEETPTPDLKVKKVRGTPVAENGTRATSQSRKASTPAQPTRPPGLPQDPSEIANTIRRGAAQGLVKLFGELIKDAVKKGSYKLPSGSTAQGLSLQIGLHVEQGLYSAHSQDEEPTNDYREQLRTIMFNLKKNVDLALRVIQGKTSPDKLATMTPKEMQSEEQQRKDAALMKEMEKQHEIPQEQQGPRMRRTHKGEEYVDDAHRIGPESATTKAPNRKPSTTEQDGDSKSRDTSGRGRQPLSVNTQTKPKPTPAELRRKSSANFDIDKVFSGVQGSPDADTHRFAEVDQRGSPQQHAPGAGTDPEIDHLLKDEEMESEPYSPKEFNDEGVVWRGTINGNSLGRFHTFAKHAAGATPEADTLRLTWQQVIPPEIQIHGRIQPQKADEYLCGLEYSNTSDLIVVTMAEPKDSTNLEGFEKFFRYLKTKQRYGVGMQHANPAIKDIYLLPMEAGQALPTFMKALETSFPDPVTERMLLVPVVIKNSELPHNLNAGGQPNVMSPSVGPGPVAQTPITPQDGQRDMPLQPAGAVPYPYSSIAQQGANGKAASPPASIVAQHGSPPPQPQAAAADSIPQNATPAVAAAIRVLGAQLAASPAVQSLVAQAPNVGDDEMVIVRECIRENDKASQDLSILTMMLQARSASSRQQQQSVPTQGSPDGASEPTQPPA